MRERAMLVGGTFDISARRGKGTSIVVHVPVEPTPGAPVSSERSTREKRRAR
jgi:glucose-6-phosphate-specific signal transduction histidine kinase